MTDRMETEHLILRKVRPDDLQAIWHNVWEDERLSENMLWTTTHSLEEAEDRLRRTIALQAELPAFFVCLKETDEPIGFAGVRPTAPGEYEDCGICVAVSYQGRGFGKEITRALMELVFEHLEGQVFLYGCMHQNLRSAAVCKALGFTYSHSLEEVRDRDGMPFTSDFYKMTAERYRQRTGRQGYRKVP